MKKFVVLYIVVFLLFSLSACKQTDDIGTFYNLREAYEEGLLTVENVQSIADYYHGTLEYSESLDIKVEQKIKETRAQILNLEISRVSGMSKFPDAKAEDVTVLRYLGEYNGSFAVMIKDIYHDWLFDSNNKLTYPSDGYLRPNIVADVEFDYYDVNSILVWADVEPKFLKEQYNYQGLPLEDETRYAIYELYNNWLASKYGENSRLNYSLKEQILFTYYGQYNGFYILLFSGWMFGSCKEEIIDGLDFSRPGSGDIFAISDDIGKTLKEAYEEGFLTRKELKEIHYVHLNVFNY